MKYIITLIFSMFFCCICYCQNSFKDSLKLSEEKKKIGLTLLHKGKYFTAVDTLKYSLAVLPKNNLDKKVYLLYVIGASFSMGQEIDSAEYYFKKVQLFKHHSISNYAKAIIYRSNAIISLNKNNIDSGMNYLLQALEYAKKSDNKKMISDIYYDFGILFLQDQNYDKAEEYFDKLLEHSKQRKDTVMIGFAINFHGEIAFRKRQFKIAEQRHRKALELFEKKSHTMGIITAKGNLSKDVFFQGNMKEAMKLSYEVLPLLQEMEFNKGISKVINNTQNMKNTYDKLDTLSTELSEKKADSLINTSKKVMVENLEILEKKNVDVNLYSDFNLASLQYRDQSGEDQFNKTERSLLLAKTLQKRDSMYQQSLNSKYAELEKKYKTQEKEKENLQLQNEATERELIVAKENRQKWIFALSLLGALLTLGVFIVFYRRNRKQKRFIEHLQTEMHHRVKNNLSIINAFIDNANDSDVDIEEKLLDLQNRIDSIFQIHEQLHTSKNVTLLNLKTYIDTLSLNVKESFFKDNVTIINKVATDFNIDPDKSFAIGMIINEFLTNSFKHAFADINNGTITIDMKKDKEAYFISLRDNGKGLPDTIDVKKLKSYGLKIISLLVEQLKGSFLLENNNGLSLTIKFPKS